MPPERNQAAIELFAEAGRLLFGPQWQSPMARELKVDSRRVRQWLSGDRPLPTGVLSEVASMARNNAEELENIRAQIEAAISDD